MLNDKIEDILFIDIETVSKYASFKDLKEREPKMAELWLKKSKKFYNDMFTDGILPSESEQDQAVYFSKSGLYPEFGRIINIGLGYFKDGEKRITSISNDNEIELLLEFKKVYSKFPGKKFFGHNIIAFDLPYISKRLVYNGIKLNKSFNFSGKKPWEIQVYDSMNIFKFGSSDYLSFDLLCTSMGVESPKTDIDGSMVNDVYYNQKGGLERITNYNKRDLSSLMLLAEKMVELS